MSENQRKMLSLLIALSMLLSMMPMEAIAQWQPALEQPASVEMMMATPDMPSSDPDDGQLRLDVVENVTIGADEDYAYLSFTPTKNNVYHFTSISDLDTIGVLYKVSPEGDVKLAHADDGGDGNNFKISQELEAGCTYQLRVHQCGGGECSFQVLVECDPLLQSLTFTPVTVVEYTNGYITSGWDDETQSNVDYYYYHAWNLLNKSTYTATFVDGTVLSDQNSGFTYDGQWYSFDYTDNQSGSDPWIAGNTYYIDVSVMGQTAQVPVTITESPLQSLTFTPVTVVEYTNGYITSGWDDETQSNVEYYCYNEWSLLNKSTYTATFTDGTVLSGQNSGFEYDGQWYSFDYDDNQSATNPWTAGNTYYIDVSVMGQKAQVPVTIVESPVASVTFAPIVVEEHKDGDWSYWDGDTAYFSYYWESKLTFTVTFQDGTVKQGGYYYGVEYDGEYYGIRDCSDDQSSDNPWLPGNTYTVQVSLGNQRYDIAVSVCRSTEENGYQYIVQDGKAIITDCTTSGEILDIPETIDGYPVVGITSLGEALWDAREIRIPDSVTMLSAGALGGGSYRRLPLEKLVLGKGISVISEAMLDGAWYLEWIEVSAENPYFTGIDGVLYNKEVTTLVAFPPMKQGKCIIPDSVTNLEIDLTDPIYADIDIQFGAGINEYKIVDGVIYSADMTTVIRCTPEATGSYTMPETVTDMERYAFQYSNLTSVTLSSKVTEIVYGAFTGSKIQEITIPENVTRIGHYAFGGCNDLEKVHIPNIEHWCNMIGAGDLLSYAHNLYINGELVTDLVIPQTVTALNSGTFSGGSFETVSIPPSLQEIGWDAFEDCENLKKVYITDLAAWCSIDFDSEASNPLYNGCDLYLNGSLVTDLAIPEGVEAIRTYAFYNGTMKSVTVPSSVKRIGYQAFYASSIETISLAEGLEEIEYYAFEKSALTSVTLPDSLQYLGSKAFLECAALESVELGGGVTEIQSKTFYKTGLKSVTIPKQVTLIEEKAFASSALTQVQFDCDAVAVSYAAFRDCPLGDLEFGDNITEIQDSGFEGADSTKIILPTSVTHITYRAFAFNANLVSVTIPATVEEIDPYAFERDTLLSHVLYTGTQAQWDELDVDSEELNQATLHCEAMGNEVTTEQTCSHVRFFCTICNKWDAVKKQYASHHFENGVCTVCGQNGDWEYIVDEGAGEVTVIGYVGNGGHVVIPSQLEGLPVTAFTADTFAYSKKLLSVTVPGTVREVPAEAFRQCENLEAVTMESGVTAVDDHAFYYCRSLTALELPDTLTSIGELAFYLNDFEEIQIPEGVTTIGSYAFYGCYAEILQLPGTLTTIGEYAFENNYFSMVEIPASVETIGAGAFDNYYLRTVTFQGPKPAMDDVFEGDFTAFYDPTTAGWEEYLAGYEGKIAWYAANAPQIRVQPQDVTVECGSIATVSAEGYGHRLSYQWYYAPYGSDTFTAIGGNRIELSMVMDMTNPNVRAYCVISDVLGRTTATQTVTLKMDAEPVGIRINRLPDLVEYDLQQELCTDGLEVMLIYSDSTEMLIEDYQLSGYQPSVGGEQVVIVSYSSYTAYFTVTVNTERVHFADKQEGVEISAPKDALDSDTVLTVERVEHPEAPEFFKDKTAAFFDITLCKGGEPVQPRGEVKVLIPVPENMNGKRCKIYRVDEQGNIQDMNAVPVGTYLEFYTDHFSLYAVAELPGYTVSGSIASPAGTQMFTVKLLCNGHVVQSLQTAEGTYRFEDVVDGSYTLEVNADGGNVRSYVITVTGAAVYQNLSVVEYTVTFLDWDGSVIASGLYFEGSLVTAPQNPVRPNDRTYSYTFTGWDQKVVPCTGNAVYTATYSYQYLNDAGSITVGSTVAGVGEQFVLPVSASDNLGIAGLKHTLTFNAGALKFIGVEFQNDFVQGTSVVNDVKADQGQITVLWYGNQDIVSDGIIYNLIFEVRETAANQTSEVTIAFNMDGNANSAGENVIFDGINGTVETRTYWLGDLNGDRKLGMVDLVMLAQYVAEFEMELTENQLLSADANEDGSIDIHDVLLLNQWLLTEEF